MTSALLQLAIRDGLARIRRRAGLPAETGRGEQQLRIVLKGRHLDVLRERFDHGTIGPIVPGESRLWGAVVFLTDDEGPEVVEWTDGNARVLVEVL